MKHYNINNEHNLRHGYSRKGSVSKVYKVWTAMRKRCNNPNDSSYCRYGGRGIKVCAEWDNFEQFVEDMGDRTDGYSIERIDNDGDYSKENCVWADTKTQARNHSRNVNICIKGKDKILQDWISELGLTRHAFYYWTNKGLTSEQAMLKLVERHGGEN